MAFTDTYRRAARLLAGPATLGLAATLAGCGATAGATTGGPALSAYVVRGAEETGFRITGAPSIARTVRALDFGDPSAGADNRRLTAEGFRQALTVHTGSTTGEGVSRVIALGSSSAATAELRAQLTAVQRVIGLRRTRRFAVAGIPGGVGLESPADGAHAVNVLFREGRCVLIVGDETSGASYRAAAVDAVRAIDARTHGRGGTCQS